MPCCNRVALARREGAVCAVSGQSRACNAGGSNPKLRHIFVLLEAVSGALQLGSTRLTRAVDSTALQERIVILSGEYRYD